MSVAPSRSEAVENGVSAERVLPDGRVLHVCEMLFTWKLSVGPAGVTWYDDEW